MKKLLVTTVTLAFVSQVYAQVLTNLVNGDFEQTIGPEWTWTAVSGTASFFEVAPAAAHTGSFGYRIAYGDDVGEGYLQQTIAGLTPGQEYQVSGWVKLYFRNDRNWAYIEAQGDGPSVSTPAQGDNPMNSNTSGIWTQYYLAQTARGNGTLDVLLHLNHYISTVNGKDNGGYFDDIVVQVPEPSSLALALLGACFLIWRVPGRRMLSC